ncbi:MAG: DegT/DnrJ/EryC1/StrS aminotransferase family protein [Actinomycetota bacterium]|nr:DegT/DnrJ/EryC1/StrS aminotransferase family protein [Actinomycetota bacterium]
MLAIDGGEPVRTVSFAPWPWFEQDDIDAVVEVLQSGRVNYWTGEQGRLFEREFADFVGSRYAVAVANGTVALELALRALGIGSGDEVIVPCRTFIASASSVVLRGARPVVVDVDADSQNITAGTIEAAITPLTKAIIAVHLAGWPCDMDAIMEVARKKDLKVIEDCAQAHGATYRGRTVGSFGDAAAFSFCQDKIMTSGGEGGMLVTDDESVWERAWAFKDHGKSFHAVNNREHTPGFRWLHESFGTNWRLAEMQSAGGRIALKKLPSWVAGRRAHAAILAERFSDMPGLRVTDPTAECGHAYYKYYVFVRPGALRLGWTRDRIIGAICAEGVPCSTGSCGEIYLERAFIDAGLAPKQRLKVGRALSETSLMFLVHPTLTGADMDETCDAVEKVFAEAASRPRVKRAALPAPISTST